MISTPTLSLKYNQLLTFDLSKTIKLDKIHETVVFKTSDEGE